MPNSRSETLAVVVPATDRPPTVARCVEALERSTEPPDELVVVELPADAGPAAARNAGVAGDHQRAGRVRRRRRRRRGRGARAAAGAVRGRPGPRRGLRRLRRRAGCAGSGLAVSQPAPPPRPRRRRRGRPRPSGPGSGRSGARRSSAAGGFDAERFPEAAIEDIELGMRLRRAGAAIVLDPEVRGTHLKRWSLRSMVDTDLRRRGAPWTRLQLERGESSSALNLGWRHRLSAVAAVAARRGRAHAGGRAPPWRRSRGWSPSTTASTPCSRRRGGPGLAAGGVALHVVHHLTAVTSVAVGARGPRARRPRAPVSAAGHPLRLGLIGCGRLAELGYAPAIAGSARSSWWRSPTPIASGATGSADAGRGGARVVRDGGGAGRRRRGRRAGDRQPAGRARVAGRARQPRRAPGAGREAAGTVGRGRRAARRARPRSVDRVQPPLPARRAARPARSRPGGARARARAPLPARVVAAAERRRRRRSPTSRRTWSTWRCC